MCSHHVISSMLTGMEQITVELEVVASSFSSFVKKWSVHDRKRLLYKRNRRTLLCVRVSLRQTSQSSFSTGWSPDGPTQSICIWNNALSSSISVFVPVILTDTINWAEACSTIACVWWYVYSSDRDVCTGVLGDLGTRLFLWGPYQRAILASDVFSLRSDASSSGWWWSLEEQKHCYFGCKYSDLQFPAKTLWNWRLVCGYRSTGSK